MKRQAVIPTAVAVVVASSVAWADTLDAEIGARLFKRAWVPAPSSTTSNDGLGPHYDARSCAACHPGGGRAPGGVDLTGYSIRLDRNGAPDPRFGRILQAQATAGVEAEGTIRRAKDGFTVSGPAREGLSPATRLAPRLAPALQGVAAFEAIDPAAILALADPHDRDGDGVSGRAALLGRDDDGPILGRYGWKASHARLAHQIEAAFALDLGMSTVRHPDPYGDCTTVQVDCRDAPHGASAGEPEVAPAIITALGHFLATRAAPAVPSDRDGAALFTAAGCAACHVPTLPTRAGGAVRTFSDLLLHDLGSDLAGDAEAHASAAEWRTAPLIGLAAIEANGSGLLHDGRATTLVDAISAHGGEAAGARARFTALSADDQVRLLSFLKRL
jgi:CxxC motif-containing protein (DUF1111 family)